MSINNLVILRSNLEATEAHILRARLEAEGIPAFVQGDQHVQADWSVAIALGGVQLQVRSRDLPAATAILKAVDQGEYELLDMDYDNT